MEGGLKNEACERTKVHEELTNMKEEVTSLKLAGSGAVSSAASTVYGLGSGTLAIPLPLGHTWKFNWVPTSALGLAVTLPFL